MKIGTITGAAALAVGSLILSAPAMAADLPDIAPVVVETPPPPAPAFSWNGPYVGVFGLGLFFAEHCKKEALPDVVSTNNEQECWQPPPVHGAGVQAGILFGDRFVFGPEVQIGALFFDEPWWAVALNLRAGVVLGERALFYAEAGVGTTLQPNIGFVTLGGGLEIGLGERLSIFGEAKGVWIPDWGNAFIGTMVQVGLNIHLGGR